MAASSTLSSLALKVISWLPEAHVAASKHVETSCVVKDICCSHKGRDPVQYVDAMHVCAHVCVSMYVCVFLYLCMRVYASVGKQAGMHAA